MLLFTLIYHNFIGGQSLSLRFLMKREPYGFPFFVSKNLLLGFLIQPLLSIVCSNTFSEHTLNIHIWYAATCLLSSCRVIYWDIR